MMAIVEGIPTLLHVAVVLFILGLIQFLFSVNLAVAGAVLGIFLPFVLLYCGMTLLPIVRAECPYRTPFSLLVLYALIWVMALMNKILDIIHRATPSDSLVEKWSQLWKHKLVAVTPDYDLAETRENKVMDFSSKPARRRIHRALCWTLESLTTDSELEPFVAGLPTLFSVSPVSVSPDRSESQAVSDAMIAILLEPFGLVSRIARLLHTCIPPTILSDDTRIKRATICLQAIHAICNAKKIETNRLILQLIWLLEQGQFSTALLSFTRLSSHNERALSSEAKITSSFIATKIEARLNNGDVAYRFWHGSAVARILYSAEQFQSLQLLVRNNADMSDLLHLLVNILADYSQENGEPSIGRQRCVQEFSKIIIRSRWSPEYFRPLAVIKSLVKFRDEKQLTIAQCANCASVRWAIHMQYYLLNDWWFRSSISNVVEALTIFGTVLSQDRDFVGRITINGELSLGIRFRDGNGNIDREELENWKVQWKAQQETSGIASSEVAGSAQYDQASLDGLVMPDIGIGGDCEAGYLLRVGISRGYAAALVIFLSSMRAFPPPEDTLELTLETLQIITKNLTVGYSSSSTQTALVHVVGRISKQLQAHLKLQDRPSDPPPNQGVQRTEESDPVDIIQEIPLNATHAGGAGASTSVKDLTKGGLRITAEYVLPMLQALLDVVGTIAHPDSIDEAKKVVTTIRDNFIVHEFPAVHDDAVNVLAKV